MVYGLHQVKNFTITVKDNMIYYRQCILTKGNVTQVAWIDEKKAKLHATVEIKSETEGDKDGWFIKEVNGRASDEFLQMHWVA